MPEAFLSPSEVIEIRELVLDGWTTEAALGNAVSLVLYRDTDMDGTATAQPATTVLVEVATAVANDSRSSTNAANLRLQDAKLRAPIPWDVRPGDRFVLPDGTAGRVVLVPPEELGIQHAVAELEMWR